MANHYQILIVGGGNAGISVAAQLLRKNIGLQIAIMDPADRHYYQPAWTLVGAGIFDVQKTIRQEKDVLPKNLVWIKEAAAAFCPNSNKVTTTVGHEYVYDWLIVCPGIQIDWHKIKGLRETLGHNNVSSNYEVASAPYTWEMIKHFKGGNALFTNPPNPIKCGGAPHKIMYLAVDYWRKKGILNQCNVHYLSGGGVLFGIKEYAATLQKVVDDNHIHTHFGVNVVEIDTKAQQVYYEEKDTEGILHRKAMHFDFCHAVAPQSAPDFIKNSPLRDPNNAQGYVAVDQYTLQHIRYPNVFALGDCINAPCSKTGAAIRKQAPVVVANLLAVMEGQLPTAQYNGYSACPIPTQYGKLMLAEFDYSNTAQMTFPFNQAKPRWSMWLLKTKVLPWLYWHKILKGTA